jgi:hypothetical protein
VTVEAARLGRRERRDDLTRLAMKLAATLFGLIALSILGCGDRGTRKSPEEFVGTLGPVDRQRPGAQVAVLASVRTAKHEGFERVVFEFRGDALPGYHIEYVDHPLQCGSGEAVDLAGNAWLEVRLTPAQAHDDEGKPTIQERERAIGLQIMKEIELTCDFEADVTWVLGVGTAHRYRVAELSGPPRLVVDIEA